MAFKAAASTQIALLLSTLLCHSQAFTLTKITISPTSFTADGCSKRQSPHSPPHSQQQLHARKDRRPRYDEDDDYYYDYNNDNNDDSDDDDADYESPQRRRRRPRPKKRRTNLDKSRDFSSPFLSLFPSSSTKNSQPSGIKLPSSVSQSLLAGTFVLGIGTGVTVDSQINTSPKDLASRDAVDQAAPNPTLCSTYGASAMAFDQRVFVSFNPFNVYVAQADVKPACVLRAANVVPVLQDRGLINRNEVKQCKDNMSNTWAFVGDLNDYPQLSCVYRSEDAQNEFLSNPKYGIGEDIYDDDRAVLEAATKGKMNIKTGLTEGEKDVKAKAAALKAKNDVLLLEKEASTQS